MFPRKHSKPTVSRLVWAVCAGCACALPAAATHPLTVYGLQDTLSRSEGTAPDLVNLGGTSSGFGLDTVDGIADRTVFNFALGTGLRLDISGLDFSSGYSVVMLFRFNELDGLRRILEFKNLSVDTGLYNLNGDLVWLSPGTVAGDTSVKFSTGVYTQVVYTYDTLTREIKVYADGLLDLNFIAGGTTGLADTFLHFFRDDADENASGSVARIRVYEGVLGAAEVAALDRLDFGPSGGLARQCPDWDAGFGFPGIDGNVFALVEFDDGTGSALYAEGDFTTVNAGVTVASHIARWDGTSWSALGEGVNGPVRALTVLDDGSGPALYVGGFFQKSVADTSTPLSNIAKWNGAAWLPLEHGVSHEFGFAPVNALIVYDDGTGDALYVGGQFDHVNENPAFPPDAHNGIRVSNIAKWKGSSGWSSVGVGSLGPRDFAEVFALAVFDDGVGGFGQPSLYVGGFFELAGNSVVNHIAQWDGSDWFPLLSITHGISGMNGTVRPGSFQRRVWTGPLSRRAVHPRRRTDRQAYCQVVRTGAGQPRRFRRRWDIQ